MSLGARTALALVAGAAVLGSATQGDDGSRVHANTTGRYQASFRPWVGRCLR